VDAEGRRERDHCDVDLVAIEQPGACVELMHGEIDLAHGLACELEHGPTQARRSFPLREGGDERLRPEVLVEIDARRVHRLILHFAKPGCQLRVEGLATTRSSSRQPLGEGGDGCRGS
jgi:hypothetical protein